MNKEPFALKLLWRDYKLPVVTFLVFCLIVGTGIYRRGIQKQTALYLGFVNVNPGDSLSADLTDPFLETIRTSPKQSVVTYQNLYLTEDRSSEDYQYSRVSAMKILGAINARQMDVVFLNQEAFDAFAQNGYLLNIAEFLEDENLSTDYVKNIVVLEDNAKEAALDPRIPFRAVTEEFPMAIEVSGLPWFQTAQFHQQIYLAVISNSPRLETVRAFIRYVMCAPASN